MNFTPLQNLLTYVMHQTVTLTKCSGLQFLLDCIVRGNTHKTPVVEKPINGKLSATVIYLGIGLEPSIICMSSPFPFSCSPYNSQGNALKTQ